MSYILPITSSFGLQWDMVVLSIRGISRGLDVPNTSLTETRSGPEQRGPPTRLQPGAGQHSPLRMAGPGPDKVAP